MVLRKGQAGDHVGRHVNVFAAPVFLHSSVDRNCQRSWSFFAPARISAASKSQLKSCRGPFFPLCGRDRSLINLSRPAFSEQMFGRKLTWTVPEKWRKRLRSSTRMSIQTAKRSAPQPRVSYRLTSSQMMSNSFNLDLSRRTYQAPTVRVKLLPANPRRSSRKRWLMRASHYALRQ